jgi:hypothetical protein
VSAIPPHPHTFTYIVLYRSFAGFSLSHLYSNTPSYLVKPDIHFPFRLDFFLSPDTYTITQLLILSTLSTFGDTPRHFSYPGVSTCSNSNLYKHLASLISFHRSIPPGEYTPKTSGQTVLHCLPETKTCDIPSPSIP